MEDRDNPILRDLLDKAAELPPAQRATFLDSACAGDQKLRTEVEALLASLDQADGFLANPTFKPDGSEPGDATADAAVVERAGGRVGRYKVLQVIGEGGFGTVFMAEQERPVRRRVALKIIKPGMDSAAVVVRFEAERQALAMMEHPNIARVYDAGTTEAGRPYFVMELVQGIPITRYCDSRRLAPRQRMELFIPVCRAIQHAHQKGIIHRDLKPSNVLVTTCDAQPVPKVIDFGVAKALHQRLTERTLFTQFGHAIGTPAYMSPEQADMDVLGADTRSDVYSLGVLLYELLTGFTPLDGKMLREAGYARMLQLIREEEPPPPSTRLASSGDALASISADRGTGSAELARLTRGDLDWIVMKCLEKDRARRYASADGLARDLERYLHDEPVEASPPSATYRLRKLIAKHRREAIGMAAVLIALVLGITGTSLGLARAKENLRVATDAQRQLQQERDSANAAAAKSRELLRLRDQLDANTADWLSKQLEGLPASSDRRFQSLLERSKLYLLLGRSAEAKSDLIALVRSGQCGSKILEYIGSALAYLGYTEEYQETCAALIIRYGGSNDAASLDHVAKTSMLISNGAGVDPRQALAWVDRALPFTTDGDLIAWLSMTKSLALYRTGDWAGCIEWANRVQTATFRPGRMSAAQLLAAMGYSRLGRAREADAAYTRAEAQFAAEFPGGSHVTINDTGENWLNYQILRREAQALFKARR